MGKQSGRPAGWFEEIVGRNEDRLLRAAVSLLRSKAEAEDAVQDTFVKLLEKAPNFVDESHETAWLLRVVINHCKSRLRSLAWKNAAPLPPEYPAQTEAQRELLDTVRALPAKYRVVIHLFYYEGYATKEIAVITKQKDSTVREQLTRARRMLKKFLEEDEV